MLGFSFDAWDHLLTLPGTDFAVPVDEQELVARTQLLSYDPSDYLTWPRPDIPNAADEQELVARTELLAAEERARNLRDPSWHGLRHASHRLTSPTRSAGAAARARWDISYAARVLCQDAVLREWLKTPEKSVRDTLILRTQLSVPFGDRPAFVEALQAAHSDFSHLLPEGELLTELSRCHHSYRSVAEKHFPGFGFPSKSKEESAARGQRRPKAKVPRDSRPGDIDDNVATPEGGEADQEDSDDTMIPPPPGLTRQTGSSSSGARASSG